MPTAPTRLPLHSILAICFALALGTPAPAAAQGAAWPALVPQPEHLTLGTGRPFVLGNGVALVAATDDSATRDVADYLRLRIAPIETRAEPAPGAGTILLRINPHSAAGEGEGSYRLEVTEHEIRITGADPDGLFHGVQTLLQLLPPDFETAPATRDPSRAWAIPPIVIEDRPRFRWRGVLLDVARHFLTVEQVKRQITLMARYKLNVLHWHLTDDQGWRLDIPALPRLTSVGAWRTEEDGTRTGGFYTAEDIREVLDHARRHHVTVVPEIDLPGHLSAAIAAYPWIGCTGDSLTVPTTWGVFNDVLCLGSPPAMEFADTVLETVLSLFPSPWIHLGGDEVPTLRWQSCAPCQELMRTEGLGAEGELQGWFTRRMARTLTERGRTLIGWDEIMDRGPLPPGVVVQAWRGPDRTRAALRAGAQVIASPGEAYLNTPPDGLPLERVYAFDPLPDSIPPDAAERLLGSEAAFWSEHITAANLDPMVWPRLLAFAEAVWTRGPREWVDFRARLERDHYTRLPRLGVTLGPADRALATFEPGYDSVTREVFVRAVPGMPGVEIRTTPDPMADSGTVTVAAVLNGNVLPLGRRFTLEPHLAWGRPVELASPPSPRYQGTGPYTLTDHALGSTDLHDGFWQGWLGTDLEATIDLGRIAGVREVTGSFLHDFRSWIVAPSAFTVWLSMDGTEWQEVGMVTREEALPDDRPQTLRLVVSPPSAVRGRWVRVRARSSGPLPDRHPGAGRPSWIFGDEIIVREEEV